MCLCVLLQFDVLAGIAVAFTIVPQSISYAAITGVPAHMGLYGAFLPVIMYAGGCMIMTISRRVCSIAALTPCCRIQQSVY